MSDFLGRLTKIMRQQKIVELSLVRPETKAKLLADLEQQRVKLEEEVMAAQAAIEKQRK